MIYCQHSFINILGSGFFINDGTEDSGLILLLDFNTNSVVFYNKDYKKEMKIREKATVDEIMEFEEMPTKTYTEIVSEMRERFENYDKLVKEVDLEIEKINNIIKKVRELGEDENLLTKAKKLLEDIKFEKKKLEMKYRVFYHRLDALNLIDHEAK